jgi:protease I
MTAKLDGKIVAILATDGVEESELIEPWLRLQRAGAEAQIVSLSDGTIAACNGGQAAHKITVDVAICATTPDRYDGLVMLGDLVSVERLRRNPQIMAFVRSFLADSKPVAALCHGVALILEAQAIEGRKLTAAESLKEDIRYCGGHWLDQAVVTDGNLTTGRSHEDIAAFSRQLIRDFAAGGAAHLAQPGAGLTALWRGLFRHT